MQENEGSGPSKPRKNQLPPLAPREQQAPSSKDRHQSSPGSGRPPRLSHRSRAGCWTCRARKVKCDETHPKCGPCTRLQRDCDWDHRWNFSDATPSTQTKYGNVTTTGNVVWDPHARRSPDSSPNARQSDDIPAFAVLTSDDERERKAETRRPGTFGVVVTPESFADLPEYAATSPTDSGRRASIQSSASSLANYGASLVRAPTRSQTDPNVVILDRFEDATPPPSALLPSPTDSRRPSLHDRIQYLSIATSLPVPQTLLSTSPLTQLSPLGDPFVSHFRHYVLPRLIQPQVNDMPYDILTTRTKDIFEIEAQRFTPLHQAICALSALNLSYSGAANVDAAHMHYGQALLPQTATTSSDELLSDGAFLRHFLLFVYDICIPIRHDEDAANMWAIHLKHLIRIAILRHDTLGPERHGYILWTICELDVYACLLGSGDCSFVRALSQHQMMPALDQQIPQLATSMSGPFFANEVVFPSVLTLRHGILMQLAKLAETAQLFKQEAAQSGTVSPGSFARWQSRVLQLQSELGAFWTKAYPSFLGPESPQAGRDLPPRPRHVFEQAFLLYQTATLYSRTSMFYRQSSIPIANQQEVFADTESRVMAILALASSLLEEGQSEWRHVVFPVFMAGFATMQPDLKIQALDIIKAYEGHGIGQNTYTTRRLLTEVYEEQRRMAAAGGRMEDVDWLRVARDRSLTVVNCGL